MVHPMIIHTEHLTNNLVLKETRLQKLLDKPKPILWNKAGMYRWVPIERIKNAIRWYNDSRKTTYPPADSIIFTMGDTAPIPKEAGDVIVKYNGHED